MPFYNSYDKKLTEDDEDSSNNKQKKKEILFNPKKDAVLTSLPKWTINNPTRKIVKNTDENTIKKIEDTRKIWENRRIKFIDDVSVSYFKVNDGKKGYFKYHKESVKDPIYYEAKKNSPEKSPGPQTYWQSPSFSESIKKSVRREEEDGSKDEGIQKKFFVDRDRTDKIITKPMKKHVF